MIRAFVGLSVPDPVAATLAAAQAGLPAGNPVSRDNLHLTLAFVGEHPEPVVEDLHLGLERISAPGFALTVAGSGLFETSLHATVSPDPGLSHLRGKVLRAAAEAGIDLPRTRFVPHITLARFSRGLAPEAKAELQDFAARRQTLGAGPFAVERFSLFESRLTRNGPDYSVLADYPLGASVAAV